MINREFIKMRYFCAFFVAILLLNSTSKAQETLPAFYIHCGNFIHITSIFPEIDVDEITNVELSRGVVIRAAKKGEFYIEPFKEEFVIYVKANDKLLAKRTLTARQAPAPELSLFFYDVEKMYPKDPNKPSSFKVTDLPTSANIAVTANASFAKLLPKDARYRATKTTASVIRNQKVVKSFTTWGAKVSLIDLSKMVQSGDKIKIDVIEVKRLNYKVQTKSVDRFSPKSFIIEIK